MDLFEKLKSHPCLPPFLKKKGHFVVDDSIGIALLTATAYLQNKDNYLLVASNLYKAQKIYSLLASFVGEENVLLFPADELIRAETIAQSKEMVAHRLYVLHKIQNENHKIVVANLAGVERYLPNPFIFQSRCFHFHVGDNCDLLELKRNLVKAGYTQVNKVDQSLQFAVRGDIIDICSVNNDNPVRIELFDNEIESIRFFDLAKQTSIENIKEAIILPGNDFLCSDEEILGASEKIHAILEKDQSSFSLGDFEQLRDWTEEDIDKIIEGNSDPNLYKYYALVSDNHYSIFDYCKDYHVVLVDDIAIDAANKIMQQESFDYLEELHEKGKIISRLEMFKDIHRLVNFSYCTVTSSLIKELDDITFEAKCVPYQANKQTDAINIIHNYLNDEYKVVVALNNRNQLAIIEEALSSINISYDFINGFNLPRKKIGLEILNLENGFVLPHEKIVYLTSKELFNDKVKVAHFDNRFKEATILKSFEDLTPGDYVVHEYQGIGQFVELQTIESDGKKLDYIKIAYYGGDILYVPLNQFQLIRKYIGKEGATPRLSHLHSKDWENTKKRIKERINDLAERLMHLYIERSKIKGFAFNPDDEFQNQFEASFEHELTKDQEKVIQEIKNDMESPSPMDRLLCGDVGFGKTEVAFRAAFKAISSGKQVAILCPTTLLARQHYEVAFNRFSPFDIRIAVLSRLINESKQKEYIKGINDGSIHLAIGTHRLLSKEISFKDLGLLIIDEEQRFGVEQKERIKELKSNVDVLTLSATPIPRTLQISLLGVRSLSLINTPPQNRMPIQTYVTPYNSDIVKELIEREIGRNGQVYYLHNDVSSIYMCANKLQKQMPNIRIGVAHGQMNKNDIEDVMLRFYHGEIDVLVCTSIVENGIDVSNANMIIVEDSERYGLSQLYQIKGRVGRSDRIAYAYLMYNGNKTLKEKAMKRLKALQEFTELGSGYKIAQRDLMIRGAGDILGPEQAGFIDSIGLDMYIKLLNESVKEKMSGTKVEEVSVNPVLSIDGYIPSSFLKESDKIELYQSIMSCSSLEDLADIKLKTIDIYGKLPKEVDGLFVKRSIDLLTKEADLDELNERGTRIELVLGKEFINIRGIGNVLFEALIPFLSFIKISYTSNTFRLLMNKRNDWVKDLQSILNCLVNIKQTHKMKEII